MPIPTRTQSVRHPAPPAVGGSRTCAAAQQGSKDERDSRKSHTSSLGTSSLPQPRKVVASGLPRVAGRHARTQSASTVNVLQPSANRSASSAPQKPALKYGTDNGLKTHVRASSTNLRSGQLRSQATAIGTTHNPQTGVKPAFNNYQQHFSPQKPRPDAQSAVKEVGALRNSTFDAIAPHLAQLHDELLQLLLVNTRSRKRLQQYATSANSELENRSTKLRQEERQVAVLEQKQQEDVNVLGLVQWLGRSHEYSAIEKVRALDLSIQQLADITDETGDFARIIQQYEEWQTDAQRFLDDRSRDERGSSAGRVPVNELPSAWHQTVEALKSRLSFCTNTLREIGESESGSALSGLISGHRQLAKELLEQLEFCTQSHSSFVIYQQQHISQTLAQDLSEAQASQRKAETLLRRPLWELLHVD